MKKVSLLVAVVAMTCTGVFAQDSGPFVSVSVGALNSSMSLPSGFTFDNSKTSWSIGGGYRINQWGGVELAYRDFGTSKIVGPTTTTMKSNATMYGGFLAYPVAPTVEAIARLGRFAWTVKADNDSLASHATTTGTNTYLGAGVSWKLDKAMSVGVNWTRFKSASSTTDDADVYEVAAQYRF